jgi:hypothetical protein
MKQDNRVAKNGGRDPNGPNKTFHAFEEVSNNIIDLISLIKKPYLNSSSQMVPNFLVIIVYAGKFLELKHDGGQKKTLHVNILLRTHYIFGHFSFKKNL